MKQPQRDFSAQTDLIATTSLPQAQVSLLENYQPNLTLEPPQRKRKKETLPIVIIVEMYSVGVKWTMITVRFGLMVMLRIANTGSIYTTLTYLANMKIKKCLLKSHNIIVKVITPIKSFGQSMS